MTCFHACLTVCQCCIQFRTQDRYSTDVCFPSDPTGLVQNCDRSSLYLKCRSFVHHGLILSVKIPCLLSLVGFGTRYVLHPRQEPHWLPPIPSPMSHDEQPILCIPNCWDPKIVLMLPVYLSVSAAPSPVPDA